MFRSTLPLYATRRKPPPSAEAAAGPQSAETLHERYLGDVYCYVARRIGRREEAEDITAEVFAAAVTAWPRYRGAAPPHLYLLGIARRKIVDARRRRTQETLAADVGEALDALVETVPAAEAGPEARLMSAERRREIHGLVATLKEEQREALLLHYVEGLPVAEAAQVMGKSPGAVNSLLQRARESLFRRGRAYFLDYDEVSMEGK
jgi:RNA polymerase sigma-70 factor (ECF subfamily)